MSGTICGVIFFIVFFLVFWWWVYTLGLGILMVLGLYTEPVPLEIHFKSTDWLDAGHFSLFQSSVSSPTNIVNSVLQQYTGILAVPVLIAFRDALIPVVANHSGGDLFERLYQHPPLTAIDGSTLGLDTVVQLQDCIKMQINNYTTDLRCYTAENTVFADISTIFANLIDQSASYISPNIVKLLLNISGYQLSKLGLKYKDVSKASEAVEEYLGGIATVTPETLATGILDLRDCLVKVLEAKGKIPEGYACEAAGRTTRLRNTIRGVLHQAVGFLPANLLLELQSVQLPTRLSGLDTYSLNLRNTLKVSSAGPESATCFVAMQSCLEIAMWAGEVVECSSLEHVCQET